MGVQESNVKLLHDLTIILKLWNIRRNLTTKRKRIGFQRKYIGTQFQRKRIGPIVIISSHNLKVVIDTFQCDHLNKYIDKNKEYCSPPQLVLQNIFLRDQLNKNIDKSYVRYANYIE